MLHHWESGLVTWQYWRKTSACHRHHLGARAVSSLFLAVSDLRHVVEMPKAICWMETGTGREGLRWTYCVWLTLCSQSGSRLPHSIHHQAQWNLLPRYSPDLCVQSHNCKVLNQIVTPLYKQSKNTSVQSMDPECALPLSPWHWLKREWEDPGRQNSSQPNGISCFLESSFGLLK